MDYIFRWFGKKFLTTEQQEEAGILSAEVKAKLAANYAAADDPDKLLEWGKRRWANA